jgi:hypothetical protein
MTGNVTVVNQNSNGAADTSDSIGALMVPSTMMVQDVIGEMRNGGFGIDSMHNFKDLRGGQSDTGDEQTLLVWTTLGKSLDGITSQLGEISNSLPYE